MSLQKKFEEWSQPPAGMEFSEAANGYVSNSEWDGTPTMLQNARWAGFQKGSSIFDELQTRASGLAEEINQQALKMAKLEGEHAELLASYTMARDKAFQMNDALTAFLTAMDACHDWPDTSSERTALAHAATMARKALGVDPA